MKANGDGTTSLDLTRIPVLAQYLNDTGVHWIFSAGSTGESVDLTVAERKAMAEAWVKVAKGYPGMRVIVHVGADSVVDARDMAAHAQPVEIAVPLHCIITSRARILILRCDFL